MIFEVNLLMNNISERELFNIRTNMGHHITSTTQIHGESKINELYISNFCKMNGFISRIR